MTDSVDLETAALQARIARERLMGTAHELQERLAPSKLIDEAVTGVKDGAAGLAQTSVEAARRRPAVAAGIAVAGVALLLRKPLLRLGRKVTGKS